MMSDVDPVAHLRNVAVPVEEREGLDWMDISAMHDARIVREMMDAMSDSERRAFRARGETTGLFPVLRIVRD